MSLLYLITPNNLIVQATLALCLTLTLSILKIPILFLQGLNTYIHPDDVNPQSSNNGLRAAIRRPGGGSETEPLKPKKRSKEKFEFDENKAQIFRLKLTDGHLQSRLYFDQFRSTFNSTFVAVSCLWIHSALPVSQSSGILSNGTIIAVLLGIAGLCKLLISIARVSLERSASKRSEKQLSVVLGFLGFLLGLAILFEVIPNWVFDVGFQSFDPLWNIVIAVFMGCIAGFLFMPAARSARTFWLGTDQIRCNLSIIYCGWIGRMLLYANYFLIIFTSWLWINPLTDILMNKHISGRRGSLNANDQLVGNLGMSRSDFDKFRVWCLFGSGLLQILALRPNLQMFLNEAVLCWYQRLHASKVPDLGFSRAKVFLHNHYLCAVVLQFYVPPAMLLIFLGFSQIHDSMFKNFQPVCILVKQVALFMAWWINFVWAIFTSTSLIQYRRGALYVS